MIKYVFVDMDNTIAENTTCQNIDYYEGLYLNKRPIQIVIKALRTLYPNVMFIILSKTQGGQEGRAEKREWLRKYFPHAFATIFIDSLDKKENYIRSIMKRHQMSGSEVLLVDDKKDILQAVEAMGVNVKYPQQLICDYEEIMRGDNI